MGEQRIIVAMLLAATVPWAQAADIDADSDPGGTVISGTFVAAAANSFALDTGEGTILVQMNGWDSVEPLGLMAGDDVTVYGQVDRYGHVRVITADAVYVEDLNTYFYASRERARLRDFRWSALAPILPPLESGDPREPAFAAVFAASGSPQPLGGDPLGAYTF